MIVHDADLEQNPFDIIKMFELSKSNPNSLILGSRTTGKQKRNMIMIVLALFTYRRAVYSLGRKDLKMAKKNKNKKKSNS